MRLADLGIVYVTLTRRVVKQAKLVERGIAKNGEVMDKKAAIDSLLAAGGTSRYGKRPFPTHVYPSACLPPPLSLRQTHTLPY
jgi:hypothetical protein